MKNCWTFRGEGLSVSRTTQLQTGNTSPLIVFSGVEENKETENKKEVIYFFVGPKEEDGEDWFDLDF